MRALFVRLGQMCSGLRIRLLVMVVLACAPLVLVMLHSAGEDRRRALNIWSQRGHKLVQIAHREEQELIDGTRQLLLAVSESSSVRSLNPARCKRWLDELFTSYPRYANLGVITTNGALIASARPLHGITNFAGRHFFRETLTTRSFTIGQFPAAPTSLGPKIDFGYPVLDRYGVVQAVVFAELDLRWRNRFGSELPGQLPKGATWTEITRDGIILARYPAPEAWVGKRFPDKALLEHVFGGPANVIETSGKGNQRVYALNSTYSALASSEVGILLGVSRSFLFAESDRVLRRNLLGLTLAAGLALVLAWISSSWLVLRPVKALVRSSARLAAGDLSARTGLPHGGDELGQLTCAFDQMAEALQQREEERRRASQKLQVLSLRLVEVQESERRHIARELHDEIGQSLTAADLNLRAALRAPGQMNVAKRLQDCIQAVERVQEQVHDLSLSLRPSMLDDLGLEPALRWFTQRQASLTGMKVSFRAEPLEARLDPVIETECFRVAQEAMTNVARHAKARSLSVELNQRDGHLHLLVRDDGVGFDVGALRDEAVRGASLGLLSMEERATLAGGGLELQSAPGQGTQIHAWFPLKWHKHVAWIETNGESQTTRTNHTS